MPAASAKLERLERDQLENRLVQLRDRRRQLERDLETLRNDTGPLVVRGNDLGITYEELADLAGISRARVAQVLAETRATLDADTGPAKNKAKKAAGAKKAAAR